MSLKDKIPNKWPNLSNLSKLGTNKIKVYAFVGPSGTGKSVLLKQLMGLIKPDSGKIFVDGFDITTANKKQ